MPVSIDVLAGTQTVEALYAASNTTPAAARASTFGVSKWPPLAYPT